MLPGSLTIGPLEAGTVKFQCCISAADARRRDGEAGGGVLLFAVPCSNGTLRRLITAVAGRLGAGGSALDTHVGIITLMHSR
jgi:hypothetical protein